MRATTSLACTGGSFSCAVSASCIGALKVENNWKKEQIEE